MTRRPTILLDVDGPLTTGVVDVVCASLREQGIANARPEGVTQWDICKAFGADPLQTKVAWAVLGRRGVCSLFEPREGAKEFVLGLRDWADVRAVMAPFDSPTWASERAGWLKEHLGFGRDEIISCHDKSIIRGDALLDDKIENVLGWQVANPSGMSLLWAAPYNSAAQWSARVDGFAQANAWLEGFQR